MLITKKKRADGTLVPKYIRTQDLIAAQAWSQEDELFLLDDSSLGFGFLCEPLQGMEDKLQNQVNSFLNQDFPANTLMQFALIRSPDIQSALNDMLHLRDNFDHPLFKDVIKERIDFLHAHTHNRLLSKAKGTIFDNGLIHDLKLIVTVKTPTAKAQPDFEEVEQAKELKTRVGSGLGTLGLRPRTLDAANYIQIMSTLLNRGEHASWHDHEASWESEKTIAAQIFDYDVDVQVGADSLRIGSCYIKVLSCKKVPDVSFFGDAVAFAGDLKGRGQSLQENYMVVVNLLFPYPESMRGSLERKRQFAVNQAFGPIVKFVPVLADKKEDFDILYDSMKEGAKPVRISYHLVIFAPDEQRLQAASAAAMPLWSSLRFSMMPEKYVTLPVFINCLPLCADRQAIQELFRYRTMTNEQAAVLLPIFGEFKGTGTYHAALISRNGQIMSLSLHDSNTNKNAVIAAESGSGKSFLVNELIFSYLSEGAQVWVIDAGRSYQKLCEMLEGEFVHFAEHVNVCLNPFEFIENYEEEEDGIVSLVCTMASARGLLDEWQMSALKQVMGRLWEKKGKSMQLDDIADACLGEQNDQRLRDIGQQLFAFTSRGSYGRYFAGKNNVSFNNQFTVLELDELQGRKHLRQVVLLQLIYQIQQEVFLGERNRKKIVIVDEAWDLLKEGEVSVFMEHAYRKFRKYGGSVIIATQSINDLYENTVGRAIAENSASMYLLGQTQETIESVRRSGRLALSEGGFEQLKTVHTRAGVYSEIFVKSKAGTGVGRLIVGAFQNLLYSTDPVDVAAIEAFTKRGLSFTEAIYAVLRQRGQI